MKGLGRFDAEKMLEGDYDFGFSTTLMRKDIGLILEEASSMNVSLPVTALVGQFLADVDSLGGANWDWCSLMERQRRFVPGRPPGGEPGDGRSMGHRGAGRPEGGVGSAAAGVASVAGARICRCRGTLFAAAVGRQSRQQSHSPC